MASYPEQPQAKLTFSGPELEPTSNGADTFSYLNPPPRYHEYVAAQQRVANWVEQAKYHQTSDSMTASSQDSEIPTKLRTRRRSSAASGHGGRTRNDLERSGALRDDPLAGSYPSPPPSSRRPVSSSRSHRRASSSGTQRRRRRTQDDDEVPPLPAGPISATTMKLTDGSIGPYPDPIPALALLSSSLVVCAMLPSILTVSVFVLFLTLASLRGQEGKSSSQD